MRVSSLSNEVMMEAGNSVYDERWQEFQAADKFGVVKELASVLAAAGLSRGTTKFCATALIKNG